MRSLLFSGLLLIQFCVKAQEPLWLRYPAISPDGKTIAFTYKGDLYTVSSNGGRAMLLTLHEGHDFMPVWSKDSKTIAFASNRYGNFDIFTIAANGGTATRLTYHSANEYPYSFSADDQFILFSGTRMDAATNRQYPAGYLPELYQVAANGGGIELLLTTPAENVSLKKDGKKWLYEDVKCQESPWRKHHQSAAARDIWQYDAQLKTHTKLTVFSGEDRNPIYAPGEEGFYYLSEESGSFNVHFKNFQSAATTQLTSFQKHPVRFLTSSTEGLMCFSYDGALYTLKAGSQPVKTEITLPTDKRTSSREITPVDQGDGMVLSPNGKEFAFIFRGDVFVTDLEGGITKQITRTPETEESVSFSPDGEALIYSSERNGKWGIYKTEMRRKEERYFYTATLLKENELFVDKNSNTQPLYAPDGNEIAYIINRNQLVVYNFPSKKTRILLNNNHLFTQGENDLYYQWSPDSRWILFEYNVPGSNPTEIGLVNAAGTRVENLSQSGFADRRPRWILGGKAIIWLSNRDGLRAASMTGGAQSDVYALFLEQKAWDDFQLSKEEADLQKELEEEQKKKEQEEDEKNKKKKKKKPETADTLQIDWDGLLTRKTKLTVHSATLGDALVSKDGETLYYLASFEKDLNLWKTNLRTKETSMLFDLNAKAGRIFWDEDQEFMYINTPDQFLKINIAEETMKTIDVAGEMIIDLEKVNKAEFEHVSRKTAETFYTAGFHGVNWKELTASYQKFLPHLGNRFEFSELLNELLGELNVSHSGSSYYPDATYEDATASLGIIYDVHHKGTGLKVTEILRGGPLDVARVKVNPGTIILAIDGDSISGNSDYAQYLNRKAGKKVLISLLENNNKRELVVKPISLRKERSLLYKRWINRNAAEVDSISKGQLGYIHIPGMDDEAYRTTFEEALGKYVDKKGLVVDTRNNSGGDLVADLQMFLSGKKFLEYGTDQRSNGFEPNFRWTKPSISLVNEANYSDGHCYAYMIQSSLNMGKLVGMPVPGTCTFGGWETLPSGDIRWGVPAAGCKNAEGAFLENQQTNPDILVRNEYDQVAIGIDQQLKTAVEILMKQIAANSEK